nr:hypothetical protein [Tanacetum cinerariifolium]
CFDVEEISSGSTTTRSNISLPEYEASYDEQSFFDEDVSEKIFSKPLFEEEIIPMKIDSHPDNAESDLMESLRTHDSSLIILSKIDSLLDEFADFLEVLVSNKQSGNPTFSLHKEIALPEVTHEIHDSKGCNFLSEKLPDIDSFNDIHPHFDDDPLSGSTTFSSNSLLDEFTDELALITYSLNYDDNLTCDIKSDLREIEFLLYQGEDFDIKDSIDQTDLANLDDLFVDPTPEMFTDEQPPDYSLSPRFDMYSNDFLEIESDANNFDDDSFDSKGEKIKEDDDLPAPNNEDKFEDFDPPFFELLVFKEVPNSMRLLPFSSENEEKVFKPGIYTSEKVHSCFLLELSHP